MSKAIIDTRYRGNYDGNTPYRMFNEVTDENGDRVVLVIANACGHHCGDRNVWFPLSSIGIPYQGEGTDAEVNALLSKLKTAGLMLGAPTLSVVELSGDLVVTPESVDPTLSALIVSSDGRDVAYQWYEADDAENTGNEAVSGEDENVFVLPTYIANGVHYYFVTGVLEDVEVVSDIITVTVTGIE